MFWGDFRKGDNPRTFLRGFEDDLAELPHLSETEKCYRFYNYCRSGSDAEYWYEELERNSPKVLTSWFTLANHFRVKWLNASPNLLLEIPKIEPVTIPVPDAATTVSCETTTTTTTTTAIPAPANTAAPATYETTERVDRVTGARHVITPPTPAAPQLATDSTILAATPVSNSTPAPVPTPAPAAVGRAETNEFEKETGDEREVPPGMVNGTIDEIAQEPETTTVAATAVTAVEQHSTKQRDREELEAGRLGNGEERRAERKEETGELRNEEEVKQEATKEVRAAVFDWASEVDEASGLSLFAHNTPQPGPFNPSPVCPDDPAPGDIPIDPVRTGSANAAPSSPTATQLIQSAHPPSQLDRATPKPAVTPQNANVAPRACTPATGVPSDRTPAASVPISPVPVDPDPGDVAADLAKSTATQIVENEMRTTAPQPVRAPPKPAVTSPNGDVAPQAHTLAAGAPSDRNLAAPVPINPVPIDPDPGDVAPNPAWSALANTAPTALIPVDPALAAPPLIDTDLAFVSTVPVDHVHVDPVSVTSAGLNLITAAISFLSDVESFGVVTRTSPFGGGWMEWWIRA